MDKQKWFDAALAQGFESFEIFRQLSEERKFTWFEGKMDTYVTSHVLTSAFRGIYEGRMVNAATENTSDDQMADIISLMKTQASMIDPEGKARLRAQEPFTEIVLKEKHKVQADQVFGLLKNIEEQLLAYDARIEQVSHLVFEEIGSAREITNTLGMDIRDESALQVLAAMIVAKQQDEVRTAFKIAVVDDISTWDSSDFVRKLAEDVLGQLGAAIPDSGSYPVIIEKDAMTSLLEAFVSIFSGEQVRKGVSPLTGKNGEKKFSGLLTIIDDPAEPDSKIRCAFDDEGCPAKRKEIVSKGIVNKFLHSTKTADALNTESTGNGFRASGTSPVEVGARNFHIVPGERRLQEMMAAMNDGIVITEFAGLHAGINHVTGDFSLQCSGYAVKDGMRAGGLTLMTAAANFIDLMNRISEIGNDLEWSAGNVASPSIRFDSVSISGK